MMIALYIDNGSWRHINRVPAGTRRRVHIASGRLRLLQFATFVPKHIVLLNRRPVDLLRPLEIRRTDDVLLADPIEGEYTFDGRSPITTTAPALVVDIIRIR